MNIGLIQTRGLGDIVIAIPIANYFINCGHKVLWPIDEDFIQMFVYAFPKINFIGINKIIEIENSANYFYETPKKILIENNCEFIYPLYSNLTGYKFGNDRLREALTFDAYKYALTNTPFNEKWNFKPVRNISREDELFERLGLKIGERYVVLHEKGSNFEINLSQFVKEKNVKEIKIEMQTNNIFDWIKVLEYATSIYAIDSVYANLIEQLNIGNIKNIFLRSPVSFTPVFKNNWRFY